MDIKGWDMVFACAMNRINLQLAENRDHLISTFEVGDNNIALKGEFDVWKLEQHGAGQLLRFSTPIKAGTLTIAHPNGSIQTVDISGISPVMEMQLTFITKNNRQDVKELKLNCAIAGKEIGDKTPGAVTCVNPDSSGKVTPTNNTVTWGLLNTLLPKIFIANRDRLAYAFAQVTLAGPPTAGWMSPRHFLYSYYEPVGGATGYLVIYSLLTDRPVPTNDPAVDGALFDSSHEVFLAISGGQFLRSVIMPLLPQAYGHGAAAANFVYESYDNTSGRILNNGALGCGSVKKGLIHYCPKITSLSLDIDNNAIISNSSGKFDITGLTGAYVTFTINCRSALVYDPGSNTLSFQRDPHSYKACDKHIPGWEYAVALIGGIIILAIVDVVIALVSDSLANSVTRAVAGSGQTSFSNAIAGVVRWNGLEHFQVQDAGLATAFFMRGRYQ